MLANASSSHLRVDVMATVSGKTITGTSQDDDIRANQYVSDDLSDVEILGGDGDDVLSDFISKSRITSIRGGNGDDFMAGTAYKNATFASFFIDGGLGSDVFYLSGTASNGTPIFTRKATATEIQYSDIDGSKFYAYVSDSTETIVWTDKYNAPHYYLTEDLSKGRQREVGSIEIMFRTDDRPDWYLKSLPDTYLEYVNYLAAKSSDTKAKYDSRDFVRSALGSTTTTPAPSTAQITDLPLAYGLDVAASTWSEKVKITRIIKSSDAGEKLEGKQIDYLTGEVAGSIIAGGKGNDDIKGFAGWDIIDGREGDDLIHGGNGRDIITGGLGADELWGDFGWNTFTSEKDGSSDLIAVKSDQYVVNWLYGKAGNNPNGEKADIIEGLDSIDKIVIVGVGTNDLTFAASATAHGATGIGIYGKGALEALYVGGDLSLAQIKSMTSGDASAAAMANTINSYSSW